MTTCSTCSGATAERSSAPAIARAPSSVAPSDDNPPPNLPIGVRAEPSTTVEAISASYAGGSSERALVAQRAQPALVVAAELAQKLVDVLAAPRSTRGGLLVAADPQRRGDLADAPEGRMLVLDDALASAHL